jgi:hypothetical protein
MDDIDLDSPFLLDCPCCDNSVCAGCFASYADLPGSTWPKCLVAGPGNPDRPLDPSEVALALSAAARFRAATDRSLPAIKPDFVLTTWASSISNAKKCSTCFVDLIETSMGFSLCSNADCRDRFRCKSCAEPLHKGSPCRSIDQMSLDMMQTLTKPCPTCGLPQEKSEGCNAFKCGNPLCDREFCWLCGMTLDSVHGYSIAHYAWEGARDDPDLKVKRSKLFRTRCDGMLFASEEEYRNKNMTAPYSHTVAAIEDAGDVQYEEMHAHRRNGLRDLRHLAPLIIRFNRFNR